MYQLHKLSVPVEASIPICADASSRDASRHTLPRGELSPLPSAAALSGNYPESCDIGGSAYSKQRHAANISHRDSIAKRQRAAAANLWVGIISSAMAGAISLALAAYALFRLAHPGVLKRGQKPSSNSKGPGATETTPISPCSFASSISDEMKQMEQQVIDLSERVSFELRHIGEKTQCLASREGSDFVRREFANSSLNVAAVTNHSSFGNDTYRTLNRPKKSAPLGKELIRIEDCSSFHSSCRISGISKVLYQSSLQFADIAECTERYIAVNHEISSLAAQVQLLALNVSLEGTRAGLIGRELATSANQLRSVALSVEQSALAISRATQEVRAVTLGTVTRIEKIVAKALSAILLAHTNAVERSPPSEERLDFECQSPIIASEAGDISKLINATEALQITLNEFDSIRFDSMEIEDVPARAHLLAHELHDLSLIYKECGY